MRQIEELYHSARERDPGERSAFLVEACGDDDDLRREVESLLGQNGSTDALVNRSSWEAEAGTIETRTNLTPGARLGPYQILGPLGAGGMGKVYRALDTRLDRAVAIKISARRFSARFEREARAISALNHPHICTLYDVGTDYLVMELVEGQTLASHLKKGPLAVDLVLRYGAEIAGALAAAHARGIVHRDLKPANVMITQAGIKVLDFGVAKREAGSGKGAEEDTLTVSGVIIGTPTYMAPEQAKGQIADRRADIWAFGVVLFEMLTGWPVFRGETAAEIMASAIADDPKLERLPASTPGAVRRLIERCLHKDPQQRLQAFDEARMVLSGPIEETHAAAASESAPSRSRFSMVSAVALLVAVAALAFVHFREKPQEERVMRFSIPIPENAVVNFLALSPDARRLAALLYAGGDLGLWLRPLDSAQFQPLSGTFGHNPFWSPDGRFIGFFAGKLKTIPASGGPAQALCDAGRGTGGTWNREGSILFGTEVPGPIMRVNAAGGPCTPVTKAEPNTRHGGPEFLPDGKHFLYVVQAPEQARSGIFLAALDDPAGRRLLADQSAAIYTPPAPGSRVSHLLFLRETTLMAQPFDAAALQLAGDPFPVAAQAARTFPNLATRPNASAAGNGVLVYRTDPSPDTQFAWLDHSGKELGKVGPRGRWRGVALSPDGKAALSSLPDGVRLRDLLRGSEIRLTQGTQMASGALVWSPDGRRMVFTKNQDLYLKDSSGDGVEELLLQSGNVKYSSDWSRDGRFLLYAEIDSKTGAALWYLPDPLKPGSKQPVKFLVGSQAQFSPDGKWVAYTSNTSGENDVYVRPF